MSIRRATFFDVVAVISRKCILSTRRANSTYPQSRVSPDRVTPSSCLFELPRLNRPSAKLNLPLENVANQLKGVKRSEEHTSELQSLLRISYDVFCSKKKKHKHKQPTRE